MKIRFGYKIFVAFLLSSALAVALMVGTMQFYLSRHFADYVNNTALDRLDALTGELASEYQLHHGWQAFQGRPELWQDFLLSGLTKTELYLSHSHSREAGAKQSTEGVDRGADDRRDPSRRLRRWAHGLALFDARKDHVAGGPVADPGAYTLKEIEVDGKTVGWLGLHKREHLTNPLVVKFLKEQSLVFYYIGGGIFILAAIVSFILSKHFLVPIRQLAKGTAALTAFDFDAKIDVRTKDELGQLAADFNTMAKTLKKYEDMRRQWISDISHELRTPLAVLKGEIEALQDGVRRLSPEALESLHSEVTHLSRLVEDLHLLSLADSDALLIRREPIEPVEVLKETVAHFRPRLAQKRIDLQLALNASGPVVLSGDSDRMAQLFANLLENSIRYTDSPGRLKISAGHDDKALWISFEDSTPGVPQESLGRLFDRLYRVDKSRSRELGGSGLGLAICKEIVEAHGGTILAANAPSGGLLVRIELPLKPVNVQ